MVFGSVLLTTGPIWGRTIWGAWWAWDPRLTFTLLLYLMFAGYFALRSALRDPVERARFGAVIGIMGTILVPFIHLTVYLFNSQHPLPVLGRPPCPPGGNPTVSPSLPWILLQAAAVLVRGLHPALHRIRDDALRHRTASEPRRRRAMPNNGNYLAAAYIVAAVILLGYRVTTC